jgi:hypothetical protein
MEKMDRMANLDFKVLLALIKGKMDMMVKMDKMEKKDKMPKI